MAGPVGSPGILTIGGEIWREQDLSDRKSDFHRFEDKQSARLSVSPPDGMSRHMGIVAMSC